MFFSIILLAIFRAIHEYYYSIVLFGFCIGSVYIEDLFDKRKVILNIYIGSLLPSGIYIIPQGIPVLPLEKYIQLRSKKELIDKFIRENLPVILDTDDIQQEF